MAWQSAHLGVEILGSSVGATWVTHQLLGQIPAESFTVKTHSWFPVPWLIHTGIHIHGITYLCILVYHRRLYPGLSRLSAASSSFTTHC